jgi:hypothetical protein
MSTQDIEIAGKAADRVIETLNQGTCNLDAGTLSRLYDSRRQAVAALHAHHAGQGVLALKRHPALWGFGFVSILLIAAWLGMKQPPVQKPAAPENSELDIQLLTGELPPQVFADWSLVTRDNVEAVCLTDS